MADAGTHGKARHLYQRVSRLDPQGWRAVRPVCGLERSAVRGIHSSASSRMRTLVRPVWTSRQAGPDNHTDRTATRLLFPVALRLAVAAAAFARDPRASDWAGIGHFGPAPF